MDTSEDSVSNVPVVSSAQSSSGLSISVYASQFIQMLFVAITQFFSSHPLVLLNVSDHYTRTKLQNPTAIENGNI